MICQSKRKSDCPCTDSCVRHGICRECVAHHVSANSLPACLRFLQKESREEKQSDNN